MDTTLNLKRIRELGVGTIVEKDGKFLIIKEAYSNKSIGKQEDMYAFPMGHVYEGEEMKIAAEREVFEETGYKIEITSILGFYDIWQAFGIAFIGKLTEENQHDFDNKEIKEVLWLSKDEILDKKLRPAVKECIEDFIAGKSFPLDLIKVCNLK